MEIKSKDFVVDCNMFGCVTRIDKANLLIGAKYPVIEMTGMKRGTLLLIDTEVVAKDRIRSARIDWISSEPH